MLVMPKSLSAEVELVLAPFAAAIGNAFPKVVADLSSWLGRQEKDIVANIGGWKTQSGFRLVAKDKHTASLPANDARTILYWFGIRLNEIQTAGKFTITATVPEQCTAWITRCSLGGPVNANPKTHGEFKPDMPVPASEPVPAQA